MCDLDGPPAPVLNTPLIRLAQLNVTNPSAATIDFLSKIKAVRTYVCDGYVISGNKAFIVYRIDADHADWGTLNMSEVAIQEWSNGKVVREKFVY